MISAQTLAGYLLEEVVAHMLRTSGYRLVIPTGHPAAQVTYTSAPPELEVRGRGSSHQVDVLGDFIVAPPFSLPIRMFAEAKAYAPRRRLGLTIVRNALGTLTDVSQYWITAHGTAERQYRYVYALFSISGFTAPAQEYAFAHQISLIDMSGPEWQPLREALRVESQSLVELAGEYGSFPVSRMRYLARRVDEPETTNLEGPLSTLVDDETLLDAIERIQSAAVGDGGAGLLAFPNAPVPLILRTANLAAFIDFASRQPVHDVTIEPRRLSDDTDTWTITPEGRGYDLSFSLPRIIANRIEYADDARNQAKVVREELGRSISVIVTTPQFGVLIVRLRVRNRRLSDRSAQ